MNDWPNPPPDMLPLARSSLPYRRPGRRRRARTAWRWAARRRRSLFLLLTGGQTVLATWAMLRVLPYHGLTWIEQGLLLLFALSFAWISVGAWLAVYGFWFRLTGGDQHALSHGARASGSRRPARTALLMPIYHEPVESCFAGLAAVYQSLAKTGRLQEFDFFVLSDSRKPEVLEAEQTAWARWVRRLDAGGRLFYRHRKVNLRHKSGNVADFLRRWGRRYDYFVVLDADSLMQAEVLLRMVELMQTHPRVGILQAPPTIVAARSRFARMQQFANALYGPLFSTGLAALQMGDGAYWGHNAIIRTGAFMRHCALPALRGFGLFRGPILSHDFVEATYMRRGGYEVWLEPDLVGSYEQSPPSLVDELARDRRWARGNLQHLALMLGERGLGLVQRLIFLNGVLAYAAAPAWMALLIFGGLEVAQFTLFPINYFPDGRQLFPLWPEWHLDWAIGLAGSTAVVLFVPKILAVMDVLRDRTRRRGFGGGARLLLGALAETGMSMLLAPVRMLAHSRFMLEALLNLELTWAGQNRGDAIGWGLAWRMHGIGVLLGLGWAVAAWWLRPMYGLWSLPISLPLMLAPWVAVLGSRIGKHEGRLLRLWQTPEESVTPEVLRLRAGCLALPWQSVLRRVQAGARSASRSA